MPLTVEQARDEMSQVLKDALAAAQSGYQNILVLWDDTDGDPPKDVATPWLRHTIKHALGGNASLGGADGKKRRFRGGVLAVQIFTTPGDGNSTADALIGIIMQAYEDGSAAAGVWYRNVRFTEIGFSGGWKQTNVYADFEYDEVR